VSAAVNLIGTRGRAAAGIHMLPIVDRQRHQARIGLTHAHGNVDGAQQVELESSQSTSDNLPDPSGAEEVP